eukprot:TRINITY_DN36417_c0_g1_i1.p1 TRINITY_DN36417_c0_g1~~TRINITY_DN36417_c0_g1_i1.p1  ORF type:complete len:557 (+),score=98.00 TRINITY_DN36417_c0_g1_i1:176-1672(+)
MAAWRKPPAEIPALPTAGSRAIEAGEDEPESKSKLQRVSAYLQEEVTEFFYDWFGALRLHHRAEDELQAVKHRNDRVAQAAVLGKELNSKEQKSERRRAKLQVVKDPLHGKNKDIRAELPTSVTRVSDYRHSGVKIKGAGWGGPPIKRLKRQDNGKVPKAQQMALFLSGDQGDDQEGLEDILEGGQVHEEDTEFFVMQTFPKFILTQCALLFITYAVLTLTTGKQLAGLETFFPGQTDLALTDPMSEGECKDFRFQVWRAITYQYSHASWEHMLGNILLMLLCGISLEGFHGSLRLFFMFEIGVLGGAGNVYVWDSHARVVGMSGGAYALLGIQLGDVVLNWERKSAPWRLLLLVTIAFAEILLYLLNPAEEISYTAHAGGGIAGLLVCVVFGRNLTINTYDLEKEVRQVSVVLLICLAAFSIGWSLINWAPMNITEQVQWCWARQVQNETIFGDLAFHCVRCDNPDCIARWSPPMQESSETVSSKLCSQRGWDITER